MDNIKPFSEDISTGSFTEIELTTGSSEWKDLLAKIETWKKKGGILHARLKGNKESKILYAKLKKEKEFGISPVKEIRYPEDIQTEEDYFDMLRQDYRSADSERKVFLLFLIQAEDDMEREKGRVLTDMEEETAADEASDIVQDLEPEEKESWIKFVKDQGSNWTPYAELKMGSADWQKLREDIKRWKKTGGILKAKLKGSKDEAKHAKRIKELVSERGPKLTTEEEDEIAATPGIIPPWFPKNPEKDNYHFGAIKAIKKLGVSALDVHLAVERDYTDKALTEKEKEILKAGWGGEQYQSELYNEKSKVLATVTNLAKHLLTKQGLKVTAKTFGKITAKLTGVLVSPWLAPLIWSPEIIDIAKSKDVQKVWKNMQSETWWKEAAKRDEIVREKVRKGGGVIFAEKNVIPRGSYYHRNVGWY